MFKRQAMAIVIFVLNKPKKRGPTFAKKDGGSNT